MRIDAAVQDRIMELCAENHMTLNKLASVCAMSQSTLNNIVSKRNKSTTVATIQKICDGLEMTICDFFNTETFRNIEQEIK